jgi:rhamnogalacturonyl hydrolase YesR
MNPWLTWLCASALSIMLLSPACAADQQATAEVNVHFTNWPGGASPADVAKRVAERFIPTPHIDMPYLDPPESLHYAHVATWYGALKAARLAKDTDLTERLVRRFDPFLDPTNKRVPPIHHVDASVFGAVPLEIYLQTQRYPYRVMGLAFADGQWDQPLTDGLTNETRFWIDDMYMITALQVQAHRATGETRYLDRAAREMVVYLDKLQQTNGLFYHAPDAPFFWGRGNGWMAAGMAELLSALPDKHEHRARILASYRQMMATLLQSQAPSGMWRQLVDHPEFWEESSATAMFTFAFVTGVKLGLLDANLYGPAARKGWLALVNHLTPEGDVTEVCVGTGTKNDLEHYRNRPRAVGDPHGQAPVLWTAAALLEVGATQSAH